MYKQRKFKELHDSDVAPERPEAYKAEADKGYAPYRDEFGSLFARNRQGEYIAHVVRQVGVKKIIFSKNVEFVDGGLDYIPDSRGSMAIVPLDIGMSRHAWIVLPRIHLEHILKG